MSKLWTLILLLLLPTSAGADPFLTSAVWAAGTTQPTHCFEYIDGSGTPVESQVATRSDGAVFCRIDLAGLATGSHSISSSGAIKAGGVLMTESSQTSIGVVTKEACSDASVCIYKYQLKDRIIWYK